MCSAHQSSAGFSTAPINAEARGSFHCVRRPTSIVPTSRTTAINDGIQSTARRQFPWLDLSGVDSCAFVHFKSSSRLFLFGFTVGPVWRTPMPKRRTFRRDDLALDEPGENLNLLAFLQPKVNGTNMEGRPAVRFKERPVAYEGHRPTIDRRNCALGDDDGRWN